MMMQRMSMHESTSLLKHRWPWCPFVGRRPGPVAEGRLVDRQGGDWMLFGMFA